MVTEIQNFLLIGRFYVVFNETLLRQARQDIIKILPSLEGSGIGHCVKLLIDRV